MQIAAPKHRMLTAKSTLSTTIALEVALIFARISESSNVTLNLIFVFFMVIKYCAGLNALSNDINVNGKRIVTPNTNYLTINPRFGEW